jgi:hypothetical protein
MTVPNGGSSNGGAGGGTHYSVPAQHQTGIGNAATTALIVVANEGGGTGGTISEFAESANGNVAPSSVISNHVMDPFAIAFTSKEGIGIAERQHRQLRPVRCRNVLALAGDFLTGIECFANPVRRTPWRSIARANIFVSAFLPGGGRAIDVFAPGANKRLQAKPKRTISDEGGLAIDSNNLLYVANSTTATIDIFPSGSGTMEAQIGGSNTGLVAPWHGRGRRFAQRLRLRCYDGDDQRVRRRSDRQRRADPHHRRLEHRAERRERLQLRTCSQQDER